MATAIYLRVSTDEQTVENQRMVLEQVCKLRGWTIAKVYNDEGISGSGKLRPEWEQLKLAIASKVIDRVAVAALDRLGRSTIDMLTFLEQCRLSHVDLYLHREGIDTSTPLGKMLFTITAAFAEFEKEVISERTKAGLVRAGLEGKKGGQRIASEKEAKVQALLGVGIGVNKIRRETGVGINAIMRIRRELQS